MIRVFFGSCLLLLIVQTAHAIDNFETPQDPALAARYQALTEELRCLVCQNQNLADSGAGLATDLKQAIVEQLQAGSSDEQIVDYMKARYGDFVSYDPPLDKGTLALWLVPLLILGLGMAVLLLRASLRKEQQTLAPKHSDAVSKLDALIEEDSERG